MTSGGLGRAPRLVIVPHTHTPRISRSVESGIRGDPLPRIQRAHSTFVSGSPPALRNVFLLLPMWTGAKEYFEYIKHERSRDMEHLVRKYVSIGPLLTKMEGLVMNTNSGRAARLVPYYAFWENKIYQSLTNLVLK